MEGSPRTPSTPRRGTKRLRTPSPSPRTPSPMPRSMNPPSTPLKKRKNNNMNPSPVRKNLDAAFAEAERLAEEDERLRQEAEEFHAEQDGTEQEVPNNMMNNAEELDYGYCSEEELNFALNDGIFYNA